MNAKHIVVFVTTPKKNAKQIAAHLMSRKVAACVNIVFSVKSFFWWEGEVDSANESLLVIKTQMKLFDKLKKAIKSKHPYTVPEIIALPIIAGSKEYLDWIDDSCRKSS